MAVLRITAKDDQHGGIIFYHRIKRELSLEHAYRMWCPTDGHVFVRTSWVR